MGNHREIGHAFRSLKKAQPEYAEISGRMFLTKKELIKHSYVSERTIRRWINRGMPSYIFKHRIYFDHEEVIHWIESQDWK